MLLSVEFVLCSIEDDLVLFKKLQVLYYNIMTTVNKISNGWIVINFTLDTGHWRISTAGLGGASLIVGNYTDYSIWL